MRRPQIFVMITISILLAMIAGCGQDDSGMRGKPPVAVEIAKVSRSDIRDIGNFSGTLSPRSSFTVAPKVAGRLKRLTVDIGDVVRSGQVIAELDDEEYVQDVLQARADLAVAEAQEVQRKSALELATRELQRMQTLRDKDFVSESDMDQAQSEYNAAYANHQVAIAQLGKSKSELKTAEVRQSYTRIKVSWDDGLATRVVGERYVDEGAMLTVNSAIVSILDNSVMTAEIDVIERDYPKIQLNQPAAINTDAFPGEDFVGKINRIAPMLQESSRQAKVEIDVPNPNGELKPGMFARVQIEFRTHSDAIVIPTSAIARRNEREGVFIIDRDTMTAKFTEIQTGIRQDDRIEILSPEIKGEIVTLGHHLLEDGGAIRLPNEKPKSAGEMGK